MYIATKTKAATTTASSNNSRLLVYRIDGEVQLPRVPLETSNEIDFMIPQTDAPIEVIVAGDLAYNRNCAVCHGMDGISLRRDTYPDLRHSSRMLIAASWDSVVLGGELQDNAMVSFADQLVDGEAEAIRAYIISRAESNFAEQ
ncbi:MAG: c-type cytochrome [Gammaproteobacteria bacterium]|nr:c-type cytochrome [Gammaproteobacteria bacterium]MCY4357850.1 c-type cytochrome [Gammaproteobacteria bacterium]